MTFEEMNQSQQDAFLKGLSNEITESISPGNKQRRLNDVFRYSYASTKDWQEALFAELSEIPEGVRITMLNEAVGKSLAQLKHLKENFSVDPENDSRVQTGTARLTLALKILDVMIAGSTSEAAQAYDDHAYKKVYEIFHEVEDCFNGNDFIAYVQLLASYIEGKQTITPSKPIILKVKSKTKVARLFRDVFKLGSGLLSMKSDAKFLEIIRVLEPFQAMNDAEVLRAIGR